MTQAERLEIVGLIIRGLLAIVVVVGGGALIILKPDTQSAVFGIIGGVVSFYFLSGVQSAVVNSTLKSLAAQGVIQLLSASPTTNANGKSSGARS